MTMNITSKQMEITPAIRQHVADRLAKLEKWQTHLINPHIILSKERLPRRTCRHQDLFSCQVFFKGALALNIGKKE